MISMRMNLIADLDKIMTGSEQNEEEEVSESQESQNDEGSLVISRGKERLVEVII